MDNALRNSFIQHFLIPLLQALWLGNLLVYRVAMEDIIIPFTGWTCPDMTCCVPDRGTDKVVLEITFTANNIHGINWITNACPCVTDVHAFSTCAYKYCSYYHLYNTDFTSVTFFLLSMNIKRFMEVYLFSP